MAIKQGALLSHELAGKMASLGINIPTRLAVALSGGADSLSLALSLSWWSGLNGCTPQACRIAPEPKLPTSSAGLEEHLSTSQYLQHLVRPKRLDLHETHFPEQPQVVALCIDHALRSESSQECHQAASQAAAMGLQSRIMHMQWPQQPRSGRVMEQASIMRYKLLHQACKAQGISVLLTGHHAGDQAENFVMRASRGSGIVGLASIAEASWSSLDTDHPLLLVRPFLGLHKWQLEAACTEQGLTWANDPTNQNTQYLRNHVRALLDRPPLSGTTTGLSNMPHATSATQAQRPTSNEVSEDSKSSQLPERQQCSLRQLAQGPTQELAQDTANNHAAQAQADQPNIVSAVLQVQRRCAAAQQELSLQAKQLLKASFLSDEALQPRSHATETGLAQASGQWRFQVQPFAEAQPAVVLHALTAVLQAASCRHKQPKLSVVRKLHAMLASGRLQGKYVANDCSISPMTGSKGRIMVVQQMPLPASGNIQATHSYRRHQ